MGIVKRQINRINSPVIRAIIKPIYIVLLQSYKALFRLTELPKIKRLVKVHHEIVLRHKENPPVQVNIAFIVVNASIWKYDELFKAMLQDKLFNPIIFACPLNYLDPQDQQKELDRIEFQFSEKKYPIIKATQDKEGQWIDLKKLFNPHVVFFTNPHEVTDRAYCIGNFLDTLTCYAPYSVMSTNKPYLQNDTLFHNLLWRNYVETSFHFKMACKYSRMKGKNTRVAGSAIYESLKLNVINSNPWTNVSADQKKIIYAPHHTFSDLEETNFSTILENGLFILEMAKKYKSKLHVAFKPHPNLKTKLYEYPLWGKEKTDEFYYAWEELPNTQLEEGDYIDLFLQSDAMILDSISFMTEYAFTGKPSLFLLKDRKSKRMFNDYGKAILNQLYQAYNHAEIEVFIQNVLAGSDLMSVQRNQFIEDHFKEGSTTFSTFVVEDLKMVVSQSS